MTYDITAEDLRLALNTIDAGCYDGARLSQVVAQLARFYYDAQRRANPDIYYGMGEEEQELTDLRHAVERWENLALYARHWVAQATEVQS